MTITAYDRLHKMRHDIENELLERASSLRHKLSELNTSRRRESNAKSENPAFGAGSFMSDENEVINRVNALIDGALIDEAHLGKG